MPASEAIEFLASYNVRVSEVMPGLILILYDTGCTVFISSLADHFCVEITCDAAINGIGERSVQIAGPIAISFLDDKAQNYVTYESPRGFCMEDLNFGVFPSGQAEKITHREDRSGISRSRMEPLLHRGWTPRAFDQRPSEWSHVDGGKKICSAYRRSKATVYQVIRSGWFCAYFS